MIATRNRPVALARCLSSLLAQSETSFRVIVVDDCSDQPLDPVVTAPRYAGLDLTLHRQATPKGPAAARNAGVALASAEYLVFLDDDVRADWRCVEVHLNAVRRSGANGRPVVSCGPFLEPSDWDPKPWNRWETIGARKEAGNLMHGVWPVTWRQFHTGNNCLPTALFRATGGFDEEFRRAEDDEFALRLHGHGCTFSFQPAAIAWHYPDRTREAWLRIPRSYAVYNHRMDRLHPEARFMEAHKLELEARHPAVRALRRVFGRRPLLRPAVHVAVDVAEVLYKAGLVRPSMAALSAAYDFSYTSALLRIEQDDSVEAAAAIVAGA
ncbi:MAG: glycosyltransferase family 2 protein [Candidatus Dormibacteraeota bacterium]|nr:glycosyltransferase family 2 protein [Candidatus Dormibacteraeota bacterium]